MEVSQLKKIKCTAAMVWTFVLSILDFVLLSVVLFFLTRNPDHSVPLALLYSLLWMVWLLGICNLVIGMCMGTPFGHSIISMPYLILNGIRLMCNLLVMAFLSALVVFGTSAQQATIVSKALAFTIGPRFENVLAKLEIKVSENNASAVIGVTLAVLLLYSIFLVLLHALVVTAVPGCKKSNNKGKEKEETGAKLTGSTNATLPDV